MLELDSQVGVVEADVLERLESVSHNVPNTHRGGCGVVALAIMRRLQYWGEVADIVYLSPHGDDPYLAPGHVVVEWQGSWWDASGSGASSRFGGTLYVSERDLLTCLNRAVSWNNAFDREEFIPTIERFMGVSLDDVSPTLPEHMSAYERSRYV